MMRPWQEEVESYRDRTFSYPAVANKTIRQQTSIDGECIQAPSRKLVSVVDIYPGQEVVARNIRISGANGKAPAGSALLCRTQSPRNPGQLLLLDEFTVDGYSADALKICGVPGKTQTISHGYIGPQHGIPGSGAHSDVFTFNGVVGEIVLSRLLIDQTKAKAVGPNNILRVVPDGAGMEGTHTIHVRESLFYRDVYQSFSIALSHKPIQGYTPKLDIEGCGFSIRQMGGIKRLFYARGFQWASLRWVDNFDIETGAPIPAPDPRVVTH